MLETIGHYRITGKLGEGGMGIVYAAADERLDRAVAIKMLREVGCGPEARERLVREARMAASVNHPGICHLYEIGEENGQLYLAMELLQGESLAARLARGVLPVDEAVRIELAMLSALQALHDRGLLHRDLKPSNIFITPTGVKILDFGVARRIESVDSETRLTLPGMLMGTPHYLPPEQLLGEPVDARGDVFSAGIVLFEMVAGKPPFAGGTLTQVLHAIAYDQPPVLGGSPAAIAVDAIIHRALAKRPRDRYPSAQAMADDLRSTSVLQTPATTPPSVRAMMRLIVLPFRIVRPDPETDFIADSLPDALTGSLSGLESLVVRSTLTASRLASSGPDLDAIAQRANVDVILTGTLLRAGDHVRVTAELVEVPSGTVRWSLTSQVQVGDVLQLQDDLRDRIIESLALPLTARDRRMLKQDAPANARAHDFYLRANQVANEPRKRPLARDLYLQCLAEDPQYAPAWARLGRIYRALAMGSGDTREEYYRRAQEAFERALTLNPDLPVAHNLYTYFEVESGRAREAMLRLLERASQRTGDAELFAGLVQACRFCGLLGPAIAAHEQARRLDPQIRTSVAHAYLMAGDFAPAIDADCDDPPMVSLMALVLMNRTEEATARLRTLVQPGSMQPSLIVLRATLAALEGRLDECAETAEQLLKVMGGMRDPCALYYFARHLAYVGHPRAVSLFKQAVEGGFVCYPFFTRDPWLDRLRDDPGFQAALAQAESRHHEALTAFLDAGGDRILRRLPGAQQDGMGTSR